MARTLEELKKRYHSTEKGAARGMMGGRGPRGAIRGAKGKPKNFKRTVARILSYIGKYRFLLVLVLFCMLFSTVATLIGSYMIAPIIDRIALTVNPNEEIHMSEIEKRADAIIEAFTNTPLISSLMGTKGADITVYIFAALIILALVYLIGSAAS